MSTRDAAAIYGCHPTTLARLARRHNVKPAAIVKAQTTRYFLWHPASVLELRRRIRRYTAQRRAETRAKRPTPIDTRDAERLRRYWQLPKAERRALGNWTRVPVC